MGLFVTLTYEQLCGSKKALDCVTVLCCVNMTGKDKAKLVMIGKSKKPHCFKGITLPIFCCTIRSLDDKCAVQRVDY